MKRINQIILIVLLGLLASRHALATPAIFPTDSQISASELSKTLGFSLLPSEDTETHRSRALVLGPAKSSN